MASCTDRPDACHERIDSNGTFTNAQREAIDAEPLALDELWENVKRVITMAR